MPQQNWNFCSKSEARAERIAVAADCKPEQCQTSTEQQRWQAGKLSGSSSYIKPPK